MIRHVRLPLVTLAVVGAALLAARPAPAQTAAAVGLAGVVKNRPAGKISQADLRVAAASMDEGRAAMEHKKFRDAIASFTKVLEFPENQYSPEAQELLGFAHQKNGELAQARAIYEDYLRRYPSGEGNDRVKQRLAGLVTAQDGKMAALREPLIAPYKALPIGKFTLTNESTWTLTGGVSSFYTYDGDLSQARDTSTAPNLANYSADDNLVLQNDIFTTVDLVGTWNNNSTSGKVRFSGGEETRFGSAINAPTGDENGNIFGVAQASVDMVVKDLNTRIVAGRQTYDGDGIFGRFDGALFSWQALPLMKVDLDGGIPANSRFNLPFGLSGGVTNQEFYGGGLDFGPLFGGLDASIYYNEGIGHWLVSREAVGTNIKYSDPTKFAFINVDYDMRFQQLNVADVTGSWTLPTHTTLYGGANYERVPFLSTWNVLLNSTSATLYDFLKAQIAAGQPLTQEEVNQLALAETPLYRSIMLGASQPVTDKLTLSADATVANLSQTITGPALTLDPTLAELAHGNEYYATAQAIWTNLFKEGDMYTVAFNYAQQETDRQYFLDFNTRYSFIKDLTVSPRLRLGYSQYASGAMINPTMTATANITQYMVMPSVLIDWNITDQWMVEAEFGTELDYDVQPGIRTTETDFFGTLGFRYSFDLDGAKVLDHGKPASPVAAAICRYTVHADGTCTVPSTTAAQ